jgi:hypothetical protein
MVAVLPENVIKNNQSATTSHLKPFITKTKEEQDMALEIKVIAWDRHKIMAGSNWQMGYQPSRYLTNLMLCCKK